ncbi:MAG TPA: FAD:protein FMN transferase, partial [Thermoanaerobaculia bacterium]|nr:FAD:protein FMN transferase [Thermoanaerobaculia bacterium]
MRRAAILLAALAAVPVIADAAVAQRARYLMGTVCEVAVPAAHEAEIELAFAEAQRVESMLSTWIEESELSRLNRNEQVDTPELHALLETAAAWSRRTNGAFDPRIKSLIEVWKTREAGALPSDSAIAAAKQLPRWEEGAFGKGYALDRMLARIKAAEAMIGFGGQLIVRGELQATIADPADRARPIVALTLRNASLSTSSGSEKTFEIGGRRFS